MKKQLHRIIRFLPFVLCLSLFAGGLCVFAADVKAIKVKEKVYMIPGEVRLVTTVYSYNAMFQSADPDIVEVNGYGEMTAKKAGTTKVTYSEETAKMVYTVVVRDEVDLIVFAGQSNMAGAGGNYLDAPEPKKGTAYEFNVATTDNKKLLTMKEPFGNGTNRARMVNGKYVSGGGTLSSAFAISYYKNAKVPIVGVPAAWGGTTTQNWLKDGMLDTTISRMKKAKKFLEKNGAEVRHIYVVWYQGESDGQLHFSGRTHINNMKKIWKKFKAAGAEKIFMIQIARQWNDAQAWAEVAASQKTLCKKHKDFIMATTAAANMHEASWAWYSDVVHINQSGLNLIGEKAGKTVGKYAKKHSD